MEAVKKLQNATKLLQKVMDSVGTGGDWRGLDPSPQPMCGFLRGFEGSAGRETMVPCYLLHMSEFSYPFQNNLNLLRDLAVHTAHSLRSSPAWGGVVTLHR